MEKKETVKKKVSELDLLKGEVPQPIVAQESRNVYDAEKIKTNDDEPKKYVEPKRDLTEAVKGVTEKQAEKVMMAMDTKLAMYERIEAFIEDKKDWVKLNDFLKALYPIPRFNEPPVYINKGEMKRMRILLDNMQSHGKLQIKDNGHGKLGNHYYEGEQQYAKFWHIGNLTIEAKK